MKLRYAFVLILIFLSALIYFIPMNSVSSILQVQYKDIYIEKEEGKWWSGSLEGVRFSGVSMGDFILKFKPKLLLSGKLGFDLKAKNKHYNFKGVIAYSTSQNYIIEKAFFKSEIDNIKHPFALTSITIDLPFLSFNKLGCEIADGRLVGSIVDKYSLLSQEINIKAIVQCADKKLLSSFKSFPKENLLSGKLIIDYDLDYDLEVFSGRIVSKIKKLAKLDFTSKPSIKFSGNILELLD